MTETEKPTHILLSRLERDTQKLRDQIHDVFANSPQFLREHQPFYELMQKYDFGYGRVHLGTHILTLTWAAICRTITIGEKVTPVSRSFFRPDPFYSFSQYPFSQTKSVLEYAKLDHEIMLEHLRRSHRTLAGELNKEGLEPPEHMLLIKRARPNHLAFLEGRFPVFEAALLDQNHTLTGVARVLVYPEGSRTFDIDASLNRSRELLEELKLPARYRKQLENGTLSVRALNPAFAILQ